ncbi:MAG: fused MFS/spermidine synthase [Candidatus Latescibacterota bacterium]
MDKTGSSSTKIPLVNGYGDRSGFFWITVIYFFSGFCSLIDEVVWVRLLKLTVGNTEYSSSIVVSVFMGGLALGALIMGRYADRIVRRLRLYAVLEMLATLSALSLPFFLGLADSFYVWMYRQFNPGPAILLFLQVMVSAAILLVPTMAMGSTLPLLSRHITSLEDRVGRLAGALYALNTLGAAAGCFLAGFLLIREFGVMGTLYIAAVINLLVSLAGFLLSRKYETAAELAPVMKTAVDAAPRPAPKHALEIDPLSRFLLAGAFASGMISIGYELVWMRSIVIPLGGHTYVFSAVLTVYLLGNVLGAFLGSRLSPRLKGHGAAFGYSLGLLGFFGIAYIPFLSLWITKAHYGIMWNESLLGMYGYQSLIVPILYSIVLFLLPSVAMGVGFPLALQGWGNFHHKVGATTGLVYGLNTIGAVAGGLFTGFVLIPNAGTQLSITLLGVSGVWIGAGLVTAYRRGAKVPVRYAPVAVAVIVTAWAFLLPPDMFRRNIVTTPDLETIDVLEGVSSTVAVKRNAQGNLLLTSNGVYIAGDDQHRITQKMLGHIGFFLHEGARDVLSIGYGSGETLWSASRNDTGKLECVEVAEEVVIAAQRYFSHINKGDKLRDQVTVRYMDAKNYLKLTENTYDLIINDADLPTHSGSAPIFMKEHFTVARDHLNRNGLVISKLHIANISETGVRSILGTFADVFPHVTLWFPSTNPLSFFYMIGSHEEQRFSPEHIDRLLNKPAIRSSVEYLNFFTSQDVLGCYIGDEHDIRRYLGDNYHINSDYKPFVEFNVEVVLKGMDDEMFVPIIGAVRSKSVLDHIAWGGMPETERTIWLERFGKQCAVIDHILVIFREQRLINRLEHIFDGLAILPDNPYLLDLRKKTIEYVKSLTQDRNAEHEIDILLEKRPESGMAWLFKSWFLVVQKDMDAAENVTRKALYYEPENPLSHYYMGNIHVFRKNYELARNEYLQTLELDPDMFEAMSNLARTYEIQGNFDLAVKYYEKALELNPELAPVKQRLITLRPRLEEKNGN